MRSQQSPFLMPSFHLPDPFLPIAEPHVFPETKAYIKKKKKKKKAVWVFNLCFPH